jgi:CxxC-x17-CxxC domain-containing protein
MCFDLQDSEDCAYGAEGDAKDSIDFNNVYYKPEYCIELVSALQNNSVFYSMFVYFSHDIWYSDYCFHSKHLFGCCGCKRGEYCILNKQYTKEEYEALVPRIIEHMKQTGEWGEFFPASYSPFGYNETIASEYYPLTREEALKLNFTWRDPDPKDYMPQTCEVPDTVAEADTSITAGILACEKTGKNFKITPQELEFYISRELPVPRMHPDERHRVRMKFRSPREIWERPCDKCGIQIQTPYAKERAETVYCEDCYNKEIY